MKLIFFWLFGKVMESVWYFFFKVVILMVYVFFGRLLNWYVLLLVFLILVKKERLLLNMVNLVLFIGVFLDVISFLRLDCLLIFNFKRRNVKKFKFDRLLFIMVIGYV